MGKTTAINIGLHIKESNRVIDLRIPCLVTETQLKSIITTALSQLHITIPEAFGLKLLNKKTDIQPDIPLSHYPLSDGDQFAVMKRRENE